MQASQRNPVPYRTAIKTCALVCALSFVSPIANAQIVWPSPPAGGASSPEPKRDPIQTRRDPFLNLTRQLADDLLKVNKSLADAVKESSAFKRGEKNALRAGQHIMDVGVKLQRDIAETPPGQPVRLSQETLSALASAPLDMIKERLERLGGRNPSVKAFTDRIDALKEIVEGSADIAKGKVTGDTAQKLSSGALQFTLQHFADEVERNATREQRIPQVRELLGRQRSALSTLERQISREPASVNMAAALERRAELLDDIKARTSDLEAREAVVAKEAGRVRALSLWVEPAALLAKAAADHASGKLSLPDLADRYSDVVISLVATGLTAPLLETPLAPMAPVYRDLIATGSHAARNALEQPISDMWSRNLGNRFELLDQYATYQARQVANRQPIKYMDDYFDPGTLRKGGFRTGEINRINDQTDLFNAHRQSSAGVGPASTTPSPSAAVAPSSRSPAGDRAASVQRSDGLGGVTVNATPTYRQLFRSADPERVLGPGELTRDRR